MIDCLSANKLALEAFFGAEPELRVSSRAPQNPADTGERRQR
jgi:hypothetical protein